MESFLGFREPPAEEVVFDQSHSFKPVPWISWDEWNFVRDSLFSSSPQSIAAGLQRIATWRSRGCMPVVIEVTAAIIEIQQKDPYFRNDLTDRVTDSEEMLAMLYCMAIMRLVNVVIEKTRKKTEISIAEAANAIGIPRMLIDIRHEGSHRDLPSLQLVRLASTKALDWLKSYYWEPQKNAIPSESDLMAKIRREIKQRLRELASCLKAKQMSRSLVKGKRTKYLEPLCGPNKFLSVMAVNHSRSKTSGFKKQVSKAVKNVLKLYSCYSVETLDVLLELLLKSFKSSELVQPLRNPEFCKGADSMLAVFDEWKSVIKKLSNKEPKLLLSLLKAVLEKILINEAGKQEIDDHVLFQDITEFLETEPLACLFEWLVRILGSRRPTPVEGTEAETESTQKYFSKGTILELLRKCLLACSHGNKHLTSSALGLVHVLGNKLLNSKLEKLLSLNMSDLDVSKAVPLESIHENFFSHEKESIDLAAKNLELIKLRREKSMNLEPTDDHSKIRWTVKKSWNPCPIGMLPHSLGSSGCLPVLDCNTDIPQASKLSNSKNQLELKEQSSKNQEAQCPIEQLHDLNMIKMGDTVEGCEVSDKEDNTRSEGMKGHLLIDGVWRRVTKEEVLAIASDIKILD